MIKAYAKSDIGKAREMNHDAYYISDSTSEVKLYLLTDIGRSNLASGLVFSKVPTFFYSLLITFHLTF